MSAEVFSVFSVHAAAPNRENRGNHTRDLNGLRRAGQFSRFLGFLGLHTGKVILYYYLIVCMYRICNSCYFWTLFSIERAPEYRENRENRENLWSGRCGHPRGWYGRRCYEVTK